LNGDGLTMVPNDVLLDATLTPAARAAYAMLASYAWRGAECWPGQETLAEDLGVDDRTVRRYLAELVERGLVERTRRGRGRTNVYSLPRQDTGVLSKAQDRTRAPALDRTRVSSPMKKTQVTKKRTTSSIAAADRFARFDRP
jgi:DNA-binding GntR family transcriptional regulator